MKTETYRKEREGPQKNNGLKHNKIIIKKTQIPDKPNQYKGLTNLSREKGTDLFLFRENFGIIQLASLPVYFIHKQQVVRSAVKPGPQLLKTSIC